MTVSKAAVLDTAKAAVADRGLNYGSPEENFQRIANRWNQHIENRFGFVGQTADGNLSHPLRNLLDATDVAVMMIDMKLARLENQPVHLDSWIDIAGYAACGANLRCPDPAKTDDGTK